MNKELPVVLLSLLADRLLEHVRDRQSGHCVRVDDLTTDDAHALADELHRRRLDCDVHVLATGPGQHQLDITADRAVELRNRKARPLVLLVPAGTSHAASSLDNSFEPMPLVGLIQEASHGLEAKLVPTAAGRVVAEVKRVLGRTRQAEAWARFLGAVADHPDAEGAGRELWRVGLIPDVGPGIESRLRLNAKAVAALARPARPTARVSERLTAADIKEGPIREELLRFLDQQDAGLLADPTAWTRGLLERSEGGLTFDQWPVVQAQQAALTDVTVTPFRRDNGSIDPQCKLRLDEDEQLICEVSAERPGTVVVKWTTDPAKADSVAIWQVEVVPPEDLRAPDTVPIAATRVKGDKRRATLHVDVDDDDLATGTLFVVRVRAQDADGNDIELRDGGPAAADSDQFEVALRDHLPEPSPRRTSAASLPEAVLTVAVEAGGTLEEDAPSWDNAGQVFGLRVSGRRTVLVRVSRLITQLQRRMTRSPGVVEAYDISPRPGEPVDADAAESRALTIPAALGDRRRKFLEAMAARAPRDVVEVLSWDDDLRQQARGYIQSYRRALESGDQPVRAALLAMETLRVHVETAFGEAYGIVLLPTHPLRLAWIAAHDELLRDWAARTAIAAASKPARSALVDLDLVARLSPANLPFTIVDNDGGGALVYAEELTHGSALYLPADVTERQAVTDAICAAIDVVRDDADAAAAAVLGSRIRGYRQAHPGTDALRLMSVNPGSGALLQHALSPLAVSPEPRGDDDDSAAELRRLEVIAYSDRLSYTDPIADLRRLQVAMASGSSERPGAHLTPPMGLAARYVDRLTSDHEGHHLAVVQTMARGRVTDTRGDSPSRTTAFHDLLTPARSERSVGEAAEWYVTPSLRARSGGKIEADIVDAHRTHQEAVAASLGLRSKTPALAVRLDATDLERLRAVHERADWVAMLDHGVGLDLFETPPPEFAGQYVLDYAPDYLDGLGKKLTVSTIYNDEVLRLLGEAMHGLGLDRSDAAVLQVMDRLGLVSGRLALRLLHDATQSPEAASLGVLIAHLQRRGQLDGIIVVPVEAHPELFGIQTAHREEEPVQRCDLLLVRVTQRSIRFECIEVKARRPSVLPIALADQIVDQLDNTERVLRRLFVTTEPARIDAPLQRARLAGLLHHYADRSARYGLVATQRLDETHRNIDRLEDAADGFEIVKSGYVVSPDGPDGFPSKHRGVSIKVLNAADLGQAGFIVSDASQSSGSDSDDDQLPKSDIRSPIPNQANGPKSSGMGAANAVSGSGPSAQPATIGVELGQDATGAPVIWEVSTKGSPHAFILGIPGQGKSVTTRRVIDQFAHQGLPSLVFDFHGDMASAPPSGAQVIDASAGLPFSPFELASTDANTVGQTAWEVAEIIAYVCGLGEIQRNHVYNGLRQAYLASPGAVPTMDQFAEAVLEAEREARGRNARDRIRPLTDFGLFADVVESTFAQTWNNGLVVDLSRLRLESVQLAASAFLLRRVYHEMFQWPQDGVMKVSVVLDEAHRLARDVTLPKLMKEGRKYGVSVVVASQGADDFHRDVLANAGTKVIFRINYPASKVASGFLRGRDGQDLSREIEQLSVGTAYVSTPDHVRARRVYMKS